ncbi:aminotransferase class V-fold PLP-dependent enzyme [Pseudoalteromonas piscicida]
MPSTPKLDDVARVLSDTYGIMCRNGHLCAQPYIDQIASSQVLRISGYLYNNESEIEHFFSALDEISSVMF